MAPLTEVLYKLLLGKEDFCYLCFNVVVENSIRLQDELFLSLRSTKEIIEMLTYLFGERFTNNMSRENSICSKCTKKLQISYDFTKMCQENYKKLNDAVESLSDCLVNTVENVESLNSLFISINTNDGISKQYYDSKHCASNQKIAIARFRKLAHANYVCKKKPEPGKPRTRFHNFSDDLFKICDITRENNRSKFICKVCSGIFYKSFNFKKHYYSQHCEKLLKCSDCNKSYGSEALLKQHKYDSHADIICTVCGKAYKNRYSLLYHMRTHSGQQPYECKHCGMKFCWSSRRAEHIRRLHLEPHVECDICHRTFKTLSSVYGHRKRHFDPNSRHFLHQVQVPQVAQKEVCI